ncbi:hypothetical protein DCS_04515 [Drechmeria coniospora]|uniref:BZIP domain-containing protein n=1 Tax=Drechmeria coniospora TaxID=98403 RepID=A0A151GK72_DRECN|nr:hypothetical protein DCS_04515 [Drechmeria coniospora]KYK57505.1 hypothetical protein DCS_04515 [Drechmeria coniospora]
MPRKILTDRTPVQFKTPESSAQNRESQRRSRARRKELIDNLSRQLEEYKRRGVQASLDMQRAARAMFVENQRLRALLALLGASPSDVSHYLSSFPSAGQAWMRDVRLAPSGIGLPASDQNSSSLIPSRITSTTITRRKAPATASGAALPEQALSPTGIRRSFDAARHQHQVEGEEYCQQPGYEDNQNPEQVGRYVDDVLPPMSDCCCPPGPPTTDGGRTEMLETPCEAAAAILVELHGQADLGQTRVALGCNGAANCSVMNTTIFRLMDELNGE